jgi:hypothetical protein
MKIEEYLGFFLPLEGFVLNHWRSLFFPIMCCKKIPSEKMVELGLDSCLNSQNGYIFCKRLRVNSLIL